jgi:xyloglucan-specific exo-beta-1,4-glucanase
LATGIEETAVLALLTPPGGPPLLSALGDIGGFYHSDILTAPAQAFHNPTYGTTRSLDYAGNKPANIVRSGDSTGIPVALSSDFGLTWSADYGASTSTGSGQVAFSADADTVLLVSSTNGPLVSQYNGTFSAVSTLPSGTTIASDKVNNTVFYGGSGGR